MFPLFCFVILVAVDGNAFAQTVTYNEFRFYQNQVDELQGELGSTREEVRTVATGLERLNNAQDSIDQEVEDNAQIMRGNVARIDDLFRSANEHDGTLRRHARDLAAANGRLDTHAKELAERASDVSDLTDRADALATSSKSLSQQLAIVNRQLEGARKDRNALTSNLDNAESTIRITALFVSRVNQFWVLICAALVFFMQAGFLCVEAGMVRRQHIHLIGVKNLIDWLVVTVLFYIFGFAIIFGIGDPDLGWELIMPDFTDDSGASPFFPTEDEIFQQHKSGYNGAAREFLGIEFFLFQLAFATTSATIVSGILAERVKLFWYAVTSMWSLVIYVFVARWVWGSIFLDNSAGWLESEFGFYDFAGSTVVHSVGAWIGLVGTIMIGPRIGKFAYTDEHPIEPYNLSFAVLGVFILILGWWGFNGGSALKYSDKIGSIVFNTVIAGATSGIVAYLSIYLFQKQWPIASGRYLPRTWVLSGSDHSYSVLFSLTVGGTLGGLVAITASANSVTAAQACLIGAIAGMVHNFALILLENWKVDDPVGGVPIHGACGVAGTLCVAISDVGDGNRLATLANQFVGVGVVFLFVVLMVVPFFLLFRRRMRLDAASELGGPISGEIDLVPRISTHFFGRKVVAVSLGLALSAILTFLAIMGGYSETITLLLTAVGVIVPLTLLFLVPE